MGKFEAEAIVAGMEKRALTHIKELPPLPNVISITEKPKPVPYGEIFKNPLYRNRTILLFLVWFFGYMTVYINAAGLSPIITQVNIAAGMTPPVAAGAAGMVVAYGIFGFIVAGVLAALIGDKVERKYLLPISAAITLVGGLIAGMSNGSMGVEVFGVF